MEIQARFDFDKLDHARENNPNLVLTLKAPTLDWIDKRPGIAIIPSVDLSGSMKGAKLEYAKKSCEKLIEHLTPGDYAGLVTFHDRAKVVVAPQKVTAEFKEILLKAVRALHVGGGTNFADGLLKALDVIQELDLPLSFLHRVIMFTDGMPTSGVTDSKAILKLMNKRRARATVSAFGYGKGNDEYGGCDQDFLTKMAGQGCGNYAYIENPDGALAAFGKELGGLLSTYATDIQVEMEAVNARVKKVVTNVEHTEDVTGSVEVPLSDILGEEVRHLVFECEVAERPNAFPRPTTLFNVKVSFDTLLEDGTKERRSVETKARVQFVRAGEVQQDPNPDVDAIIALHQTIRAQLEAEEEAKAGNFLGASQRMLDIREQIAARGHHNVALAAQEASWRLGSAVDYASNRGYLTSYANAGTRAFGTPAVDEQAAVFLTAAGVNFENQAMTSMSNSFSGAVPGLSGTVTNIVPSAAPTVTTTGTPTVK